MTGLLGAVLAGGRSERMGRVKAGVRRADGITFADVACRALREVCDDVVVLGHGEGCPDEIPRVPDVELDVGPLGGLRSLALTNAGQAYLIVPCDLPHLRGDVLRELVAAARAANAGAAVFSTSAAEGPRPLPLYVTAGALAVVEDRFRAGERKLTRFVASLAPLVVDVSAEAAAALRGVNTLAELRALEEQRSARAVRVTRFQGGAAREDSDVVAEEEPLELRVNGASLAVTMRTPGHDEELATGFLVSERVVRGRGEIASLRHCSTVPDPEAEENVLDVTLREGVELDVERLKRNLFASSSCGVCGKATLESALATAPALDDPYVIHAEQLYALPERLREAQRVFDSTGGLHAAALFDDAGVLLVVREDVGRHNAVDKVIGWALQRDALASARVLLVSGRVSFEIVQKAAAARVPVLAAISAPSSLAVRLGEAMNLTVVGFLRGRGLNVYSAKQRVRGA